MHRITKNYATYVVWQLEYVLLVNQGKLARKLVFFCFSSLTHFLTFPTIIENFHLFYAK